MTSFFATSSTAKHHSAYGAACTLFFIWGFVVATNDPLIAALRHVYALSYAEATLTQFAFFMAYGLVSLPASALLARAGASRTIALALGAMAAACLVVIVSSDVRSYALVLAALFLMASGTTLLQVAANPLAAAAGPATGAHFRLTFAQAVNSLGVVAGVQIGSSLMLAGIADGGAAAATDQATLLGQVDRAYLVIAGMIGLLLGVFLLARRAVDGAFAVEPGSSPVNALRSPWARRGALAVFLYVGAEISIGSVMINFLAQETVFGVSLAAAGWYLAWIYWFGALVGRFFGSVLLRSVPPPALLLGAAACALALSAGATWGGPLGGWAALGVGFFNSIMFPVIFTTTLERTTAGQAETSGLLCMGIIGGAVLPVLTGQVADRGSIATAFLVPACAYAGVLWFAVAAGRTTGRGHDQSTAPTTGHH